MIKEQSDALFPERLGTFYIGAPRYMEQAGWERFTKRPIGTGSYVIDGEMQDYRKVAEGEVYATLTANSNYWEKGYPKIRRIKFVQQSSQEALRALIEGRVDLVTSYLRTL